MSIKIKNVRVHTCYSIDLGDPRPIPCHCRELITAEEAENRVRNGLADYVVGYDRPKSYQDNSQICMIGRLKQTPRGATIEKAHMERAFVYGDIEEQYRIEMYGFLTLMSRISVGKTLVKPGPEPVGGRRHDYGRSILFFPADNRT